MSESDGFTGGKAEGYIFSFANTREAIDAEKKLLAAAIPAGVMPLPPEIGGAGCGICLRVSSGELDRARMVLDGAWGGIYALTTGSGTGREKNYRPWEP